VFWGAFTARDPERHRRNIAQLLGWLAEGKLRPHVSATYPLEQAAAAITDLEQRRALGKVVVTP
jgi:NADPH2:quinone reductase